MENRKEGETYTFYDGPPTANGKPHIGHVLTRVIKDINAEGNGYDFKVLRAKALYTPLVKDRVKYTFDTSTIVKWTPTTSMSMATGYSESKTLTAYTFSSSKVPNRKPVSILLSPDAFSRMLIEPKKRNEERIDIDEETIIKACDDILSNKNQVKTIS